MKTTQERPVDFNGFCSRYILRKSGRRVASHFQLFPGIYTSDQQTFDATETQGSSLPVSHMPADYLGQVKRAKEIGSPFRRLRVLPDVGQRVGSRTYSAEDLRVMRNMSRRNQSAGEDVHITSYGEQAGRLEGLVNRYIDEYMRGVDNGVSRLSFWSVAEAGEGGEPELIVVRLMSYDAAGKLVVRHCLPPLDEELAAYVDFWQGVYASAKTL